MFTLSSVEWVCPELVVSLALSLPNGLEDYLQANSAYLLTVLVQRNEFVGECLTPRGVILPGS